MPSWDRLPRGAKGAVIALSVAASAAGGVVWRRVTGETNVQIVRGEVERVAVDGIAVRLADSEDPDAIYFVGTAQR